MLADLTFVLDQFVLQRLLGKCGSGRQTGHTINDIADQMETVKIVEYAHVESRGDGVLLLVAAGVKEQPLARL